MGCHTSSSDNDGHEVIYFDCNRNLEKFTFWMEPTVLVVLCCAVLYVSVSAFSSAADGSAQLSLGVDVVSCTLYA
jgi:hypothetical protein